MKAFHFLATILFLPCVFAQTVEIPSGPVAAGEISATASSSFGGISPTNAINGAGLDAATLLHDNEVGSATMWHTAANATPSSAANGVPMGKAWFRIDLRQPSAVGSCMIWNHNQSGLTDRGFRHVRAYVSRDGSIFAPVSIAGRDVFEIPRASGQPSEAVSFRLAPPAGLIKSLVLVAEDNWGSDYFGLAEVRLFTELKKVDIAKAPLPTSMTAEAFPFRTEADGSWRRQIEIALDEPLFARGVARIACGGASVDVPVDPGSSGKKRLTLDLPPGKGNLRSSTDKVTVSLKAGRFEKTLETAIVKPKEWPDLEEVVVTFKCHLDIGYTHTVPEVIEKYRTGDMDRLLQVFDQTKDRVKDDRFLWMLPAWAMEIVLDEHQNPERRKRLEQSVKDGRLLWHSMPYTFESEAGDAEEIVRGLGYGTRMAKRFGMPLPTEAKQTDMPEQAWILPTVLKNAGVNFLHIGANDGSKPNSEWAKVPTLSWWEGPDGSRILLGYSDHYGWSSIKPPAKWPHKSWLAFFVLGDNAGPPSPSYVASVLSNARAQLPGVRIRFGRPSEFADSIMKEEKEHPTLPVVRGDMPDTWTHGQMSCPQATGIHRRAAPGIGSLGILDTSLRAWGVAPAAIAPTLAEAYALGGFYGEHTWGINGSFARGTYGEAWRTKYEGGFYKKFEETYDYHMNYGRKASAIADEGLSARIGMLAKSIKADGPRVVVFNPLPWTRDAQAEMQLPESFSGSSLAEVIDLATGKAIPFAKEGRTLTLSAKEIPPGGYRAYVLKSGTSRPSTPVFKDGTLETPHFIAKFDLTRGGIVSLKEKATGRELVDSSQYALGQFLHERFSAAQTNDFVRAYCRTEAGGWVFADFGKGGMPDEKTSPYLASTPSGWTAQSNSTPVGETVVLTPSSTLGLAKGYALKFTFPRERPCVDIEWSIEGKTPNPIPEGGWLCLPFKVESPSFKVGRVGGTIDPLKDIIFGANRRLLSVDRGITVRAGEAGAGMAAASADLPLWSLGEPGLWKYSPTYQPSQPVLFANLYNNMWNTNYPLWIAGSWKASLRVWPVFASATEEQALFTPSWEVRQPIVVGLADGAAGSLAPVQNGIALSRKGTRVSALCPNPDGEGLLLRLWEQAGESGEISIALPKGIKATRAQPVNLRGEKSGPPLIVKDGRFSSQLGAWAPKSWILE